MLVIAPIVGISLTPLLVVKLIPLVLILSLSLSGLGILVATRMRSQQGFQFVVQLMIFPLIFLSGVFFPIDGVPTWLQVIAKVNPLSYGVDAIRQVFLGPPGGQSPRRSPPTASPSASPSSATAWASSKTP